MRAQSRGRGFVRSQRTLAGTRTTRLGKLGNRAEKQQAAAPAGGGHAGERTPLGGPGPWGVNTEDFAAERWVEALGGGAAGEWGVSCDSSRTQLVPGKPGRWGTIGDKCHLISGGAGVPVGSTRPHPPERCFRSPSLHIIITTWLMRALLRVKVFFSTQAWNKGAPTRFA